MDYLVLQSSDQEKLKIWEEGFFKQFNIRFYSLEITEGIYSLMIFCKLLKDGHLPNPERLIVEGFKEIHENCWQYTPQVKLKCKD